MAKTMWSFIKAKRLTFILIMVWNIPYFISARFPRRPCSTIYWRLRKSRNTLHLNRYYQYVIWLLKYFQSTCTSFLTYENKPLLANTYIVVCDEKIDTIEKMEEQSEMRNETFVKHSISCFLFLDTSFSLYDL